HVQYLGSLEQSERVRKACLAYMQHHYIKFYPERPDLIAELQALAANLGGCLEEPKMGWKYAWLKPVLRFEAAKWAHVMGPELKASLVRRWDKAMYLMAERSSTPRGLH